ncbi:MAG: DUF4158 domain-containing protein [Chloroflexi bacterium]|nr:DUF4158 domain-containing protein [Chloroflexota bacterium]MBV9601344.1 DUF4158 domain-containing protein [Chloroflexota bacterium]
MGRRPIRSCPATPSRRRDRERVNVRRAAHNKLGLALQLTSVRFLAEPTAVPSNVVAYVAAQLGIRDVTCLADYAARPTTAWEHAAEIRRVYGYRDFNDPGASLGLVRWAISARVADHGAAERAV